MTKKKKYAWRLAALILMTGGWPAAGAQEPGAGGGQYVMLDRILDDPALLEQALVEGEEAAFLCDYCHGSGGNSVKPDIPNIASQNPHYMLDQFARYLDGVRVDFTGVMKGLVEQLTPEERMAVVVYYANQPLVPPMPEAAVEQTARGRAIYDRYCQTCHGADGRGDRGFPRIAGQQSRYIAEVLRLFRDGSRGLARDRHSEAMEGITTLLDDADIEALSVYGSGLY